MEIVRDRPERAERSLRRHAARSSSALAARVLALAVGLVFAAYAFSNALYILLLTAIVVACVWRLLGTRGRHRNSAMARKVGLLCAVTVAFWVCTTTAVRFADSSGTEDGAGATSLVNVSPWGHNEDPSGLMVSGILSAVGLSALVFAAKGHSRKAVNS